MDLAQVWPPSALRVVSGDLELRYADDPTVEALARMAATEGVHPADFMPFMTPWTVGTAEDVARSVLRWHWKQRAELTPERWQLELATWAGGRLVGTQGAVGKDYAITRSAETGSWLGLPHHGQGIGTRMRLLILHLLFDELDAEVATTGAFADNGPSLGVTRKLGYEANGESIAVRWGAPAPERWFRLTREQWLARPDEQRLDVTYEGTSALREFLGIARP